MDELIVATQLYQWGQEYRSQNKSLEDNLDEAFGKIASAGFSAIELNLTMVAGRERADSVKELLKRHSLEIVSLYHGGVYHERYAADKTVEEMKSLAPFSVEVGCPMINVNPAPIGPLHVQRTGRRDKTDDELKVQCEYLNRVGSILKDMGLAFVIHNHNPEIRNNAKELRADCAGTDPELVGLCLDLHWVYRGGVDPLSLLREYIVRVKSLHLRNSVDGIWSETLGDGDIDYREVNGILRRNSFAGTLIVELAYEQKTERTKSLAESHRLSRDYVRAVFGV